MHELSMGTTGNKANNRTTQNPHDTDRYTRGFSSVSTVVMDLGLCSATVGTDGKYSVWFNDVFSTDISDNCENVTIGITKELMQNDEDCNTRFT
ncbi:hypothetical protein CQW23_14177 [Capsicum baccatum]|uniref:Uncharacterized protein n=1 Tax=Capsicum baccatum TaxID=33114 RepID=A0A2G2WIM5_CAPBA|nr:hypothetical protein CQW23_14177 [Capsicum baccatum]